MSTVKEEPVTTFKAQPETHMGFWHNIMRQKTNYLTSKEAQGIGVIELVFN